MPQSASIFTTAPNTTPSARPQASAAPSNTLRVALADCPAQALADWAQDAHARLHDGQRLMALWGRPEHSDAAGAAGGAAAWGVWALWLPATGGLQLSRAWAAANATYPALSLSHPSAQALERELFEQTGLQPEGHPWRKPLRFEHPRAGAIGDYPFFQVRGQEVHEVGVGPIHAGVIEPGHFRFMCHGEQVQHLEIQLGYQHRGAEALLRQRSIWRAAPLVESMAGDTVLAHTWAHAAALEALIGWVLPEAITQSRAVGLELERIAMHLSTLGGLCGDVAYAQALGTYQRLRTAIINLSQRLCGNRFGRGWVRAGWAPALGAAQRDDVHRTLRDFARDMHQVSELVRHAASVGLRFRGVGRLSHQAAADLGLQGVVARACGVALDVRQRLPAPAWLAGAPQAHLLQAGDCWARLQLRLLEIDASVAWLLQQLELDMPTGLANWPDRICQPRALPSATLGLALVEGTRGVSVHAIETDAQGQVAHVKLQDPSLLNWMGLALALRDNAISDFPLCNKSFDLSYCGHDL